MPDSNQKNHLESLGERLIHIEETLSSIAKKNDSFSKNGTLDPKCSNNDEIDLRELWNILWRGKWIVICVAVAFAITSAIYVVTLPNIYKSSALLAPSKEASGGGLSALSGQLGGLASLAGIALPQSGNGKVTTAIEVIKSRQFISDLIQNYNMLVPLMATKGWDRRINKLIIDDNKYNEKSNRWVRNVSLPKLPKPSMWEAYKEMRDVLSVTQDNKTGLVSISVEHYSPFIAREWVEIIVGEINTAMKEKDVSEAQKSINYLHQQLEKTSVADMRSVFFQLIEEQSKIVMLAEVRDEYVFSTIDPPVVAEEPVRPKRILIIVLSAILGGLIGMISVFIRSFSRQNLIIR